MSTTELILQIDPASNLYLFAQLIQQMGVYAAVILLAGKSRQLQDCMPVPETTACKLRLGGFFILIVAIGEAISIPFHGTRLFSNTSVIMAAGYLYGTGIGIGVGAAAGLLHLLTGGWAGYAHGLIAVLLGLGAGWMGQGFQRGGWLRQLLAISLLSVSKLVLLPMVLAGFRVAFFFVIKSGLAVLLTDILGTLFLLYVLNFVHAQRDREQSIAAAHTLDIAGRTLRLLWSGFSPENAQRVCEIIRQRVPADLAAITDRRRVLAHSGQDALVMQLPESLDQDPQARRCLQTGQMQQLRAGAHADSSVLYVPLQASERVNGLLILRNSGNKPFSSYTCELVGGLRQLIAMQIELGKLQKHKELSVKAELLALQRQINPHFFFNSLNTIMSLIRTDPPKAKRLLLRLSEIFRATFKSSESVISLSAELDIVRSYLELEKARFGDRIEVSFNVSAQAARFQIPQLIVQPLVENAISHGFRGLERTGHIAIDASVDSGIFLLCVSDDGRGIDPARRQEILRMGIGENSGVGLSNVYERLRNFYGKMLSFDIESEPELGFKVKIAIREESAS